MKKSSTIGAVVKRNHIRSKRWVGANHSVFFSARAILQRSLLNHIVSQQRNSEVLSSNLSRAISFVIFYSFEVLFFVYCPSRLINSWIHISDGCQKLIAFVIGLGMILLMAIGFGHPRSCLPCEASHSNNYFFGSSTISTDLVRISSFTIPICITD